VRCDTAEIVEEIDCRRGVLEHEKQSFQSSHADSTPYQISCHERTV
jgi:hypothetical protein